MNRYLLGTLKHCLMIGLFFTLFACSASTYGKFQTKDGVPSFIKVGQTTRQEVFTQLGEPLVHRFVAGKETAIYNNEHGYFAFLYGTYEGHELIVRFENQIVAEARIEKTGDGWGILAPATTNNPGTSRSSR